MLVKGLFTQLSGSIGGLTGYQGKGGLTLRARAIPTDPCSDRQALVRSVVAFLIARWSETLTQDQRDAWAEYADKVELTGPLGDLRKVSGMNHYIRSNTTRRMALHTILDNAPTLFDLSALSPVVLEAAPGTDGMSVVFSNADEWATAVGGHLYVFQSRPQNPTVNYFRGPYVLAHSVAGAATPPTSPDTWTSPFALAAGQKVFARVCASTADGRYTAASFLVDLVEAA